MRNDLIKALHLTGPLARASGAGLDTRSDHPYGIYHKLAPQIKFSERGDVLARFEVKASEVLEASRLCQMLIATSPIGEICTESHIREGSAFSLVESCRGQNLHFVSLKEGKISRYKARTASFCNWQAIEHAVTGNIVPDFPLINKSLNLSYAGTDL